MISGSVDIGLAVGTLGAMAAFSKGAPVRIIGAQATGAADYWYAKTTSGIKTLKDTNGQDDRLSRPTARRPTRSCSPSSRNYG